MGWDTLLLGAHDGSVRRWSLGGAVGLYAGDATIGELVGKMSKPVAEVEALDVEIEERDAKLAHSHAAVKETAEAEVQAHTRLEVATVALAERLADREAKVEAYELLVPSYEEAMISYGPVKEEVPLCTAGSPFGQACRSRS